MARARVKVRKSWGVLNPATRVIEDKRRKPHRKRKHKARADDDA